MSRRVLFIIVPSLIAALLGSACADSERHRALTFFFDGVPAPGEAPKKKHPHRESKTLEAPVPQALALTAKENAYIHSPYRENKCRECHDPNGTWLSRTPEDGLCQRCHPDIPGLLLFQHGPVATNACLKCHNPHASPFPSILLADPRDICYGCHKTDELTKGPHHAALEEHPCLECHGAHGGDDRFFLKRPEP